MFLKSLTLRGFKSFADKTTLEFEPGVTVVVGPNGSGKSNIVDSVAWVLGAQGARALRGAKMDDVIFAGTADRPALGRAEVSLTIDNAAGLLPIEFSEVTVTRTLFRTGDSEYQINGAPCRLLDITELLSDTGIGRQQHVIVGQGQLDSILNSRAEERRAVIEEAAGILKFRKRKEKAERRLEATEGNLLRLTDLLREVRRQLRPLERQAEAARRHDGIAADLRAVRLHLAGREVEQLHTRAERRRASRAELAVSEQDLRVRLRGLDTRVSEAERALAAPGEDDIADVLTRTEALRERARGLRALLAERRRGIEREVAAVADEGVVETLVADAVSLRDQLATVEAELEALQPRLAAAAAAEAKVAELAAAHIAAGDVDEAAPDTRGAEAAAQAAQVERHEAEGAFRALRGRHEALDTALADVRDRLAPVDAELATLDPARAAAADAARRADEVRAEVEVEGAVAPDLTPEGRARAAVEHSLEAADRTWRDAQAEASRWQARAETLALALEEVHSASGIDAFVGLDGVMGPLADHLEIESGYEDAVAAALGDALRAIVVEHGAAARAAVDRCKRGDLGALLLVAGRMTAPTAVSAPSGARPLVEMVRGTRPGIDELLARLLAPFLLVDSGWERALDLALADPRIVAITREGDRFGGGVIWRAGPAGPSAVTPQLLDEARERAAAAAQARAVAEEEVEALRLQLAAARRAELVASERHRARRAELDRLQSHAAELRRDVEVREASLAERRAQLRRRLAELEAEAAVAPDAELAARERFAAADTAYAEARARLERARAAERDLVAARDARRAELEARREEATSLRRDVDVHRASVEERRTVLSSRLIDVERRLAARPDEEAAARRRRMVLASREEAIGALEAQLTARASEIDRLAERLRRVRRQQSEAARDAGRRLDGLRAERSEAERSLAEVRERVSRLEVEDAEIRLRLETIVEGIRRDFDCEPGAAVSAPAPEVPEGTTLAARARELERELRLLGPVNPLALSEYEALLERHEFLQAQLEDVKNTRRELARVIKAVDAEIVRVFGEAFADVAMHFSTLFATLFPGGAGRLVLTDPDDLLATGIEIEARPSGKTVRRLSLLSGGERSLTALAYLFAVFRARPSPFYLLDEVEAALDDVNLHRFLDLVHEFRDEAQLVIVSHQKRTMEAADVLYGVSMPPGGSSRVVSQRIRDLELEPL